MEGLEGYMFNIVTMLVFRLLIFCGKLCYMMLKNKLLFPNRKKNKMRFYDDMLIQVLIGLWCCLLPG